MRISALRSTEFSAISYYPHLADGAIVSFGSGPDIYRPLVDFPWAQHFHLVDILTGWGKGPGHIIEEIQQRLLYLHPDLEISIIDQGFVAHTGTTLPITTADGDEVAINFTSAYWERWHQQDATVLAPLTFQLTWRTSLGKETKYLYLHPLDYSRPEHLSLLFNSPSMRNQKLAGILIAGIAPPEGLLQWAYRLDQGGTLVVEHLDRTGLNPILAQLVNSDADFATQIVAGDPFFTNQFSRFGIQRIENYLLERR